MPKFLRPLLPLALLSTIQCAQFQRTSSSGYADSSNHRSLKKVIGQTTSDAPESADQVSDKQRIKSLESRLSSRKELEQYSKALPWFKNNDERIEFLTIRDYEDKQKWLADRHFFNRRQATESKMRDLVEAQDIAIGMPADLVKRSWGDPDNVEVSGNSVFKNERWKYQKYISTPNGYRPEKKIVYFEGGQVVGWEVE